MASAFVSLSQKESRDGARVGSSTMKSIRSGGCVIHGSLRDDDDFG